MSKFESFMYCTLADRVNDNYADKSFRILAVNFSVAVYYHRY